MTIEEVFQPEAGTLLARGFAPKRGRSGSVNILGKNLNQLSAPRAVFGSLEVEGDLMNPQLIKAEIPSLPDGVHFLRLLGTVQGSPWQQVLGVFTVGPPIGGLICENVYPETIPAPGGSTIYILGNGFLAEHRSDAPLVLFNNSVTRTGHTLDDAVIEVVNVPSARDLRVFPGDPVEVEATFSDGQSVVCTIIFQ